MSPSPEQIDKNLGLDVLLQENIYLDGKITQIVEKAVPQDYHLIGFVFDKDEDEPLFVHPVIIADDNMRTNWNRLVVLGGTNFSKKVVLANPNCNNRNFKVFWTDDFVKDYVGGEFVAGFSSGKPCLKDEENERELLTSGIIFLKNSTNGSPFTRMTADYRGKNDETTVISTNHLLKTMLEGLNKARGQTPTNA